MSVHGLNLSFQLLARSGTTAVAQQGNAQGWLMPLTVWDAPSGFDSRDRPDNRPYNAIAWRLQGGLVRRVLASGQVVEELRPRGFSVHPSHHDLRFSAPAPLRFAHFYFSDDSLAAVGRELAGTRVQPQPLLRPDRVMYEDPEMNGLLDAYVRRATSEVDPPTRLEMDSRAQLILLQLLGRHGLQSPPAPVRGALAPHQLRLARELLAADLAADIGLREVADKLGVSLHHFCRAFRVATGVPPHEWRVLQRIDRAAELLRTTDRPVTDVAAEVGYHDPNQLTRLFRSRRGTTPQAYRRTR